MDWPIFAIALVVSLFNRKALLVAGWVVINTALLSIVSTKVGWYWQSIALWAALFSIKDFALLIISAKMRAPLIILIALFASCTFHQLLRFQIMTYTYSNLTLLDFRPSFMMLLSVIMIATVMTEIINGGGNGGKRARTAVTYFNNRLGYLFRYQVPRTRQ